MGAGCGADTERWRAAQVRIRQRNGIRTSIRTGNSRGSREPELCLGCPVSDRLSDSPGFGSRIPSVRARLAALPDNQHSTCLGTAFGSDEVHPRRQMPDVVLAGAEIHNPPARDVEKLCCLGLT